jgi:hypothetical protein
VGLRMTRQILAKIQEQQQRHKCYHQQANGDEPNRYWSSEPYQCNKFVAHSRDSDDQFGSLGILLQFLTKAVYMHIYSPRECSAVIAPD